MKILDIISESVSPVSDKDFDKIEFILGFNGDEDKNTHKDIENALISIEAVLKAHPEHKEEIRNALLLLNDVASTYLSNPLWKNVTEDPASARLRLKINTVQQECIKLYNNLID